MINLIQPAAPILRTICPAKGWDHDPLALSNTFMFPRSKGTQLEEEGTSAPRARQPRTRLVWRCPRRVQRALPRRPEPPPGHAANDVCKRGDQLTVAPSEVGGCGPGDGFFVAFGDLVCSGGYLLIHEKHLCTFTEFGSDDFTWEGDRERGGRGKGAAQELRRDREIVLKAVALHGSAFQYAAEEAKK